MRKSLTHSIYETVPDNAEQTSERVHQSIEKLLRNAVEHPHDPERKLTNQSFHKNMLQQYAEQTAFGAADVLLFGQSSPLQPRASPLKQTSAAEHAGSRPADHMSSSAASRGGTLTYHSSSRPSPVTLQTMKDNTALTEGLWTCQSFSHLLQEPGAFTCTPERFSAPVRRTPPELSEHESREEPELHVFRVGQEPRVG
ncbi:hypothetical protein DNTS_021755 [Danionella cerebrum]|uniref:Uncharacterized protein n=1 Tax=Danionella cerebrum TaxID=2873325 RepID=A0A553QNN6_9TELE|nr:hypothetical protein DNTS_021755 [Danionella translucida]